MSFKAELRASLGWNWIEGAVDNDRLDYAQSLLGGSGAGQADAVWFENDQSLTGGTSTIVDLANLPRVLLGSNHCIVFDLIKVILLINRNTEGASLVLGGAETEPWAEPFGGADQQVQVPPDSPLLLSNRSAGWPVDSAHHHLKITASGGDVTYDLVILGVLDPELSYA